MKLIISNLSKSFKNKDVIVDTSAVFQQGKIYALLGRNGAGKTTLFNLISSNIAKDSGEIHLEEDGQIKDIEQKDLFFMVANPLLPNFLTGREFIKFFIDVNKERITEERGIDELFDWISFDDNERDDLIQFYSLGTRNKLQMLMFILLKPKIILMDEPLTSLDVIIQLQIKNLLKEIEKDHIIIFSTHILQLAIDLCDEITILDKGKLIPLSDSIIKNPNFEDEIMEILKDKPKEVLKEEVMDEIL